ncbi:hypothetical protein [Variovorax boronicumulans]|uniref:hypothetical protein n=1 Tax=Variovorax boronicumulans TaxID=436515 RepID=UPI001C5A0797
MATSSAAGAPSTHPVQPDDDTRLLGPSDSSDSGSDTLGQRADLAPPEDSLTGTTLEPLEGGSDSAGTGERADAEGDLPPDGADILPDRIIGPGGGRLDPSEVHSLGGTWTAEEAVDEGDEDDEDAA